jgi:hypothetical protein
LRFPEQIATCIVYVSKAAIGSPGRIRNNGAIRSQSKVRSPLLENIMKVHHGIAKGSLVAAISAALLLAAGSASAHCDGRDGPVVAAAQQALDTGNVNRVLIWVQSADEAEIRQAFGKARAVRKLDPAAKELADSYFFETVVRVHAVERIYEAAATPTPAHANESAAAAHQH